MSPWPVFCPACFSATACAATLCEHPAAPPMAERVRRLDARRSFHAHLDTCRQCFDHPFDLCPVGAVLIRQAVVG